MGEIGAITTLVERISIPLLICHRLSLVLANKWDTIFGSVLLTETFGMLADAGVLDIRVCQIAVPLAVVVFTRNVVHDRCMSAKARFY